MVKRMFRTVVMISALAVLAAACGEDTASTTTTTSAGQTGTTAAAKKRVAIAFVGPLTGPNANLGINIRDGARVALKEANDKSQRYEYVLKEFDTQGDPAQAPGQLDKYVNDSEVIGIVGPTFSGETKAVIPTLESAGLVMVSASATNVELPTVVPNGKVFHRIVPDDDVQARGLADYVQKELNAKSVALVHDNTEYGKGLYEGVLKLLQAAGIATVVEDAIDPAGTDYSAAVNRVRAATPEVIFYGGYYNEAGRLKKQLTDAGVTATFVSGDGSLDPGFIVSAGAAGGEGAQITCPCRLATADAPGKVGEFAKAYKAAINKDPGTYSAEGYDAINILIQGVEAGNDARPELLDYVEGLSSFDGVSKQIEFEANGNVKAGIVYVYEVKGGKLVELGTTEELSK